MILSTVPFSSNVLRKVWAFSTPYGFSYPCLSPPVVYRNLPNILSDCRCYAPRFQKGRFIESTSNSPGKTTFIVIGSGLTSTAIATASVPEAAVPTISQPNDLRVSCSESTMLLTFAFVWQPATVHWAAKIRREKKLRPFSN